MVSNTQSLFKKMLQHFIGGNSVIQLLCHWVFAGVQFMKLMATSNGVVNDDPSLLLDSFVQDFQLLVY